MIKKIVLAGGCFWGIEAFFTQLDGVINVMTGYANSDVQHPSYQEVKSHVTTAAEAVEITYDDQIISLEIIFTYLLKIIDVTAVDHQGGDYGHQYRSGIYYTSLDEKELAISMIDEIQKTHHVQVMVEVLPLANFFLAEDYHQHYLAKNPDGYCHINFQQIEPRHKKMDKQAVYEEVLLLLKGLLDKSWHPVTILANVTALLEEKFPYYSWVGFYLAADDYLYLGPFQGQVACEKILFGQGVCGMSFQKRETIIVEDVHRFSGHIACDSESQSEIVVPLYNQNDYLMGVLDVDSYRLGAFDSRDKQGLERVVDLLKDYLD